MIWPATSHEPYSVYLQISSDIEFLVVFFSCLGYKIYFEGELNVNSNRSFRFGVGCGVDCPHKATGVVRWGNNTANNAQHELCPNYTKETKATPCRGKWSLFLHSWLYFILLRTEVNFVFKSRILLTNQRHVRAMRWWTWAALILSGCGMFGESRQARKRQTLNLPGRICHQARATC